ncbi:hypothetical protein CLORY_34060 [Clostridium oryzae]|uniref:Uncharacterized protein n=1 Tax=Clostridium oryzae TaxID=1450648 RepID=A0A1V4IGS0_9CLOT|nr:hypothetical protein CLORY_34060 [Clostridium oryzae]
MNANEKKEAEIFVITQEVIDECLNEAIDAVEVPEA